MASGAAEAQLMGRVDGSLQNGFEVHFAGEVTPHLDQPAEPLLVQSQRDYPAPGGAGVDRVGTSE